MCGVVADVWEVCEWLCEQPSEQHRSALRIRRAMGLSHNNDGGFLEEAEEVLRHLITPRRIIA